MIQNNNQFNVSFGEEPKEVIKKMRNMIKLLRILLVKIHLVNL